MAGAGDQEKVLRAFVSWLLPDVRNDRGSCDKDHAFNHRQWDHLWASFKSRDSMDWPTFDTVIPWDCKMGPLTRRIFDILDDGSGLLTKRSLLNARRHYERTLVVSKPSGLDALRKMLMQKYSGSLMMGWRALLDPMHRGFTSHAEFVKACKSVGFAGDLKEAWKQLTGGNPHRMVTLADLDPESDRIVSAFVRGLRSKHSSAKEGWQEAMKTHGTTGRLRSGEFAALCHELDLTARESKILFAALDLDYNKLVDVDAWNFLSVYDTRTTEESAEDDRAERPDHRSQAAGSLSGSRCGSTARFQAAGAASAWHGEGADGTTSFEFVVVLSREEHAEYQRRRRERAAEKKEGRLQSLAGGYPGSPSAASLKGLAGGYPGSPSAASLKAGPVPSSWSLASPPGSPRSAAAPAADWRQRPVAGPLSGLLRAV